jgi:hypothetical protein
MQVRWAVLLREEPSSKDYRGAVSSNSDYVPGHVIADDHRRHTAKVAEGARVRADPIGE